MYKNKLENNQQSPLFWSNTSIFSYDTTNGQQVPTVSGTQRRTVYQQYRQQNDVINMGGLQSIQILTG